MKTPHPIRHTVVFISLLFPQVSHSYDIGCLYPSRMLEPFAARDKLIGFTNVYNVDVSLETTVGIHKGQAFSYCDVNCLAHHDDRVLHAFTRQRPSIVVPSYGHNSWSRMMCIAQCYSVLFEQEGNGEALQTIRDTWILPVAGSVHDEIVEHYDPDDPSALRGFLQEHDYDPLLMGQLVVHEINLNMVKDGWNMDGSMRYGSNGEAVPCTSNCMSYSDTTGYFPRNHPRRINDENDHIHIHNHTKYNHSTKYLVTGNDIFWQPLLEDDGLGYFIRQEHVTPHIGFSAQPLLRDPSLRTLDAPHYDYHAESRLLLERLRDSASNPTRWDKIAFYDKKFLVRLLIERELVHRFADAYPFELSLLFVHGISAAEHDAVLQAWREKVRHDLVRPTTVIQRWGAEELRTFDGDRANPKVATIMARDFRAFVRVMPHSEYPSGSSCICANYAEFTDGFTTKYFRNQNLTDLRWGLPGGVDLGCRENSTFDHTHAAFYGCGQGGFEIANMTVLSQECGESRLWGGMHFTRSVAAGRELCAGLGELGLDYVEVIQNRSDFGTSYVKGMERPQCGDQMKETTTNSDGGSSSRGPSQSPTTPKTNYPTREIVNEVPLTRSPTTTATSSSGSFSIFRGNCVAGLGTASLAAGLFVFLW